MQQNCGPFGKGPTTVASTCAPSVREWYHTLSARENILGLKKGQDTLYTAFGERISQNTHRCLLRSNGKAMQGRVCGRWGTQTTAIDIAKQNSEVTVSPPGGGISKGGVHPLLLHR